MKIGNLKNLTITAVLVAASYYLFSESSQNENVQDPEINIQKEIKTKQVAKNNLPISKTEIEGSLPPDLEQASNKRESNDPNDLPDDLKAQLAAPPPELPDDLKQQLKMGTQELPEDLKAQLNAPAPPLPEDIQAALKVPPRVVSIEEVNGIQNQENEQ